MKKAEASAESLSQWRRHPFTLDVVAACRKQLKRLRGELVEGDGSQRSPEEEGIRTKELRAQIEGLLHFLEERWVSDLPGQQKIETTTEEEVDPYEI